MTEEEHEMLKAAYEWSKRLDTAFFEVPPGSSKDTPPLIEDLRTIVRAWQRGSWSLRTLFWFLPLLAGFILAYEKVVAYVKGWGG